MGFRLTRLYLLGTKRCSFRRKIRPMTAKGCDRSVRRYSAVVLFFGFLLGLAMEIAAFVVVARQIGFLLALLILIVVSAMGPFIVRRVGVGVLAKTRDRLQAGELPTRELLDGVVILVGGALICLPGFIGDAIGLLLMVGPVRHVAIRVGGHRVARRVTAVPLGRWRVTDASSRPAGADRPPASNRPDMSLEPGKYPPHPD